MMFIFIGVLLIILGILFIIGSSEFLKFYKKLKNGKLSNYSKVVGVVICDAYSVHNSGELIKPVTPIVEYEVAGKKYEAMNSVLENDAELPVGTKVYVWYDKNNPAKYILGTETSNYLNYKLVGITMIFFGVLLVLLNIEL